MLILALSSKHFLIVLLTWLEALFNCFQPFREYSEILFVFILFQNHHILNVFYVTISLLLPHHRQIWAHPHSPTLYKCRQTTLKGATYIHAIGLQVFNNKKKPPYKSICTWSRTELYSSLWRWSNMVHLLNLNTILLNSQQPQCWIWNTKWAAGWESIFATARDAKQLSTSGPRHWLW